MFFMKRPDRATTDIEGGQLLNSSKVQTEEDQKKELITSSLLLQVWSLVRSHAPSLLRYIGEKPPRLDREQSRKGLIVYQSLLHLVLFYYLLFR